MQLDVMAILTPVTPHFCPEGRLVNGEHIERGHINRTFVSTIEMDGVQRRYVHQLINSIVFPNPPLMMENIRRVIDHLRLKRPDDPGLLELISNEDGHIFWQDADGSYWRTYNYVEGSTVFDVVPNAEIAYEAALTFGKFLNDLADLDPAGFHITIPNFHNTPSRLAAFDAAVKNGIAERLEQATSDIEFVTENAALGGRLMSILDSYPEACRVTHNDTKVNNVLFCEKTKKGLTVIDLDTVMPGTVLFDVGDLVRTACNSGEEDEPDLSKVNFRTDCFDGIIDGFVETTGDSLHASERENLAYAGAVITFECGVRFLTDYLTGDTYFKTHRENQNLDRARTQFHLVKQMLDQMDDLRLSVARRFA